MVGATVLDSGNSWILLYWLLDSYCCAIFPPSSSEKCWKKLYVEPNATVSLIQNSTVDKTEENITLFSWHNLYVQGEKEHNRKIIWLGRHNFASNKVLIHSFVSCSKQGRKRGGRRSLRTLCLCPCRARIPQPEGPGNTKKWGDNSMFMTWCGKLILQKRTYNWKKTSKIPVSKIRSWAALHMWWPNHPKPRVFSGGRAPLTTLWKQGEISLHFL